MKRSPLPVTDKAAWLDALRADLTRELDAVRERARDAAEAATHEENRPEGDKDMRSTEASYIARGQALQAAELEAALARLAGWTPRDLDAGAAVEAGALVTVVADERPQRFWLLPVAGGRSLEVDGGTVRTLATKSPLGVALLGLRAGDEAEVATPQGLRSYEVVSVE